MNNGINYKLGEICEIRNGYSGNQLLSKNLSLFLFTRQIQRHFCNHLFANRINRVLCTHPLYSVVKIGREKVKKIISITLKITKDINTLMDTNFSISMMENFTNSNSVTSSENGFTIESP